MMSIAVQGGSNMDPKMLTSCWIFCYQLLNSRHLRTTATPSCCSNSFSYEERSDGERGEVNTISAVFIGKYQKRRESGASRNGSTIVDISIPPPFIKPVSLSLSRFSLI